MKEKINNSKKDKIIRVSLLTSIALATSFCFISSVQAQTLPVADSLDGNVSTQTATTVNPDDTLQVIHNGAANAVFQNNWTSFDVPANQYVDFNFSAAGQVSINRVTGVNVSQILGGITQSGSGGTVFLVNPNGILFGAGSSVDVNSFVASTLGNVNVTLGSPLQVAVSRLADPKGIQIQNGAQFLGEKLVFASNAIYDAGSTIDVGEIAFITADGVNFKLEAGEISNLDYEEYSDDYTPSSSNDANITLPDNVTQKRAGMIDFNSTSTTANIFRTTALINKELSSDFLNVVNLDGVITANGIADLDTEYTGGKVVVYAVNENANVSNDLGVTFTGQITAHNSTITSNVNYDTAAELSALNTYLQTIDSEAEYEDVMGNVFVSSPVITLNNNNIKTGIVDLQSDYFDVTGSNLIEIIHPYSDTIDVCGIQDVYINSITSTRSPGSAGFMAVYNALKDQVVDGSNIRLSGPNGISIGEYDADEGEIYTANVVINNLTLKATTNIATLGSVSVTNLNSTDKGFWFNVNSGPSTMQVYDTGAEATSITISREDAPGTMKLGTIYSTGDITITAPEGTTDNQIGIVKGYSATITGPITISQFFQLSDVASGGNIQVGSQIIAEVLNGIAPELATQTNIDNIENGRSSMFVTADSPIVGISAAGSTFIVGENVPVSSIQGMDNVVPVGNISESPSMDNSSNDSGSDNQESQNKKD